MITKFELTPIATRSKGAVRRLRLTGFVPVSIQHKGMDTQHFQQEARPLDEYIRLHGEGTLLDLHIMPGNEMQRVMVHEVQRDPVTAKLVQVTFQQLRLEDVMKTTVPLLYTDVPAEANSGEAILQHRLDKLDIECEQGNLPDHIVVSLASLHLGGVLRVADLPANPKYRIVTPEDTALASLTSNRNSATEEAAAPATA